MQRIRTVKPELFKHETLFDAELETGLPLRIAFVGLWTCCDREGRFKWRPRALKLDVLPYDDVDFSRVLDVLATRGFIVKYACNDELYGCVPSFTTHQMINNRESLSELPGPEEGIVHDCEIPHKKHDDAREFHASPTRQHHEHDAASGEGKGREGKGTGREEYSAVVPTTARSKRSEPNPLNQEAWDAYSNAYFDRYRVMPVRNAKTNSQVAQLVKRLGENAPHVAGWFLSHNKGWYVQKSHSLDCLVKDAEGLYTQWATNRQVTESQARSADRLGNAGRRLDSLVFDDQEPF